MQTLYFTIKNFPDDVYYAVGKIIQASQEWEQDFKELVSMIHLQVKKINESSLNKLCGALKKHRQITEKEFEDLKRIIKARNYINHEFFLTDFREPCEDYDLHMENLQTKLNFTYDVIFEATDFIKNKIDRFKRDSIMRPSVVGK